MFIIRGVVFSIRGRGLQTSNDPATRSQNAKEIFGVGRFKRIAGKIPAVLTSSCKSLSFPIASSHVLLRSLVKRTEISWAEREIRLWVLGSVPSYVPIFAETPLGLCHRPSCDLWRCKSSPCIWDLSSFGPGKWGAWTIQTWSCCLARYWVIQTYSKPPGFDVIWCDACAPKSTQVLRLHLLQTSFWQLGIGDSRSSWVIMAHSWQTETHFPSMRCWLGGVINWDE